MCNSCDLFDFHFETNDDIGGSFGRAFSCQRLAGRGDSSRYRGRLMRERCWNHTSVLLSRLGKSGQPAITTTATYTSERQVLSAGGNRKKYNRNCDNACIDLKLR
jgi:hypothetical protein